MNNPEYVQRNDQIAEYLRATISVAPGQAGTGKLGQSGPSGSTEPQRKPPGYVTLCRQGSSGMAWRVAREILHTCRIFVGCGNGAMPQVPRQIVQFWRLCRQGASAE
jgi:hypothetical protein